MRTILVVIILATSVTIAFADEPVVVRPATGNVTIDLASAPAMPDSAQPNPMRYSPGRAILYSAVLPGAGQAYMGDWWQAALFFGVEVAGVTGAIVYNQKGNAQTDYFQNYADGAYPDGNWSVVRYAQNVNNFVQQYNLDSQLITIDPSTGKKPWDRVNWSQMNKLEKEIGDFNQSTGFSHTLPAHGDQQYYEEIGKYPQYGHGWDDDTTGDHYGIGDAAVITPHLQYYAGERGKANNLYAISTTATIIVLLNHIASAIEAGFSARSHNNAVQVGFTTEPIAINGRADIKSTLAVAVRL